MAGAALSLLLLALTACSRSPSQCSAEAAGGHGCRRRSAARSRVRSVRRPDGGGQDRRGAGAGRGLHRAPGGARRRRRQGRRPPLRHRPASLRDHAAPGAGQRRPRHRPAPPERSRAGPARGGGATGPGQPRPRHRAARERAHPGAALSHAARQGADRRRAVRPAQDEHDRAGRHGAGRPGGPGEAKAALGAARAAIENARATIRADEAAVETVTHPARLHEHPLSARRAYGTVRGPRGQPGRPVRLDAAGDGLHARSDVRQLQRERARGAVRVATAGHQARGAPALTITLPDDSHVPTVGGSTSSTAPWIRGRAPSRCARRSRTRSGMLQPGQYARLRVLLEERPDALVVPQAAIQESQGSASLFVVGPDQTVQARTVRMGPRFGPLWVVEEGLKPGEDVVVKGLQQVRAGMRVEPTVEALPAATGRLTARCSSTSSSTGRSSPRCSPSSSSWPARWRSRSCRSRMFPEITPPQVEVTATYPGASAEVVEDTVTTPIEQQVNGVEDMIYMSSRSGNDGTMTPHRDVRGRHRPRHRRGERAEPRRHRPGRSCPPT